jgi:hypothetical protein
VLSLANGIGYQGVGVCIAAGEPPPILQDLVAVPEPPCINDFFEALQTLSQITTLVAANGMLLRTLGTTSGHQKILTFAADHLDSDLKVVSQPVPSAAMQFALELDQLAPPGCQDIFSAGSLKKCL